MNGADPNNLTNVGFIARILCWMVAGAALVIGLTHAAWLISYTQRVD